MLGLGDLIFIVLGTVIGSGIFIVPGTVLRQVDGRLGVSLAVWVVGGALSLLGALTFGELGAMAPEAGGIYVYIRDAYGRLPAFLYGWTFFFVVASGSVATLAVASVAYLKQFVPLSPQWRAGAGPTHRRLHGDQCSWREECRSGVDDDGGGRGIPAIASGSS